MNRPHLASIAAAALGVAATGCADVEGEEEHGHHHDHNHGVITTVDLTFKARSDGTEQVFTCTDPNGDGNVESDEIVLDLGEEYDLVLDLWNDLEDPREHVTPEITEAADEHQFFFVGEAVDGPATPTNPDALIAHAYGDFDENGNPLGIENEMVAINAGASELNLSLRHLPPQGGNAVKTSGLAADVAAGGLDSIPGEDDILVSFDVLVE